MTDVQSLQPNQPNEPAQSAPPASSAPPTVPLAASNQPTQGKYQVTVLAEKCISAASCIALAPKTLAFDENKIAKVIDQNGDADEMKLLAAQSCPTQAVIITDTSTGKQIWPPPTA